MFTVSARYENEFRNGPTGGDSFYKRVATEDQAYALAEDWFINGAPINHNATETRRLDVWSIDLRDADDMTFQQFFPRMSLRDAAN
jgi:hypothetical protein